MTDVLRDAAARIGAAVTRARAQRNLERYDEMSDRELWRLTGFVAPEDLPAEERQVLDTIRGMIVSDPKAYAREMLSLPDGDDRDLAWSSFQYLDKVSHPAGDHELAFACLLVSRALRDAGISGWFETPWFVDGKLQVRK